MRGLDVGAATQSADVADFASLDRASTHIEQELGPIDIWVNNTVPTILHRSIALGQVPGTMAALSRVRPWDQGTIVKIGAALPYRAIRSCPPRWWKFAATPGMA